MAITLDGTNGVTSSGPISGTNGTFTGNVGIGTSSPAFKVDAQTPSGTNVAINATKTGTDAVQMGVDTGPYINGGANLGLRVGGTERFRIASAGQIGINGANYGTAGQVLTSGGASAAPSWVNSSTGFGSNVVTLKNRASGTVFQNTTGGWLFVAFAGTNNGTGAYVGSTASPSTLVNSSNATYTGGSFMVPPSWYYYINYSGLTFWSEGQA